MKLNFSVTLNATALAAQARLIELDDDTIDLSDNELDIHEGSDLAKVFAAIPSHVSNLKLDNSGLGYLSLEQLREAFDAIPRHVSNLSLRSISLTYQISSIAQLEDFLTIIPDHITTLDLTGNTLIECFDTPEEKKALCTLLLSLGKNIVIEEPVATALDYKQKMSFLVGVLAGNRNTSIFKTFGVNADDGQPVNPLGERHLVDEVFEFLPKYTPR